MGFFILSQNGQILFSYYIIFIIFMKIFLIQPPVEDFYQTSIRTKPIGLAYLASSLKKFGHEVAILDCQTKKKKSIPIPKELSYLKDFYPFNDKSPFKLYTGYYHFGMSWDEIEKKIAEAKADIFGISSSFTPYHGEALRIAKMIKDRFPNKVVVIGGAHVSCSPLEVLKNPYINYIIMGEGEYRLPILIEIIEKERKNKLFEIDGIGYKDSGEIKINPIKEFIEDLDLIPYPSRELLDLNRYRINKKLYTMIITSRGCPHGCAYCSAHLVMGNRFRSRSIENIIEEMKECYEKYRIEIFDIEDDNLTYDPGRAKNLMKIIIKTFGEKKIELLAMNGISFASMDEELIELMARAGFKNLNLSLVSSSDLIQKHLKRPSSLLDFDQIIKAAIKVGLNIIAYAIFGIPGQCIEEMIDTLIYMMGRNLLIGPSIYYPIPGTILFERCKKEALLPNSLLQYRSTAFPIETRDFSRLDLITLLRLTRMINFIKGKIEEGEIEEGITLKGLFHFLKSKTQGSSGKISWVNMLLTLFKEKSFFSLIGDYEGRLFLKKEISSNRVLSYFFERAWEKPILKYKMKN